MEILAFHDTIITLALVVEAGDHRAQPVDPLEPEGDVGRWAALDTIVTFAFIRRSQPVIK